MRRCITALVCALALFVSCVPPEESNDRIKRYDPEVNIMGQIQERGVLRVGLPEDYPPFAVVGEGKAPEGFLVDLSILVAEALGVEPEFSAAPSSDLLDLVHVDEDGNPVVDDPLDMVFPMVPITEELVQTYTFSDPYWVGHSREIVGRSDFGVPPPGTPDVELLRFAYEFPGAKIAGEQQSTEGYGAAVRTGTSTFATFVSQVINEAEAEGDWSRFYERWLAEYFEEPAPEEVPTMSVEEAAALYPTDLG